MDDEQAGEWAELKATVERLEAEVEQARQHALQAHAKRETMPMTYPVSHETAVAMRAETAAMLALRGVGRQLERAKKKLARLEREQVSLIVPPAAARHPTSDVSGKRRR